MNEHTMNARSVNPEFGDGLRKLRRGVGLSVVDVAKRTGISRSNVHRLEAGEIAEPGLDALNALAEALEVEPEALYDIAWQTTGNGPALPSMPTYFRTKYQLNEDQIAAVMRTIRRVTKPTTGLND